MEVDDKISVNEKKSVTDVAVVNESANSFRLFKGFEIPTVKADEKADEYANQEQIIEEKKIEEDTKIAEGISPFDKGTSLDKASAIFGQSEEEMKKEFRAFKASKLFKKFDCDLTECFDVEALDRKLSEAKNTGFGAVVVTPPNVKAAKEKLGGVGIEVVAAVCFPFGEECFGVKKHAVKKAFEKGADRVYLPIGISVIKRGLNDKIRKEFKRVIKVSKKRKVSAVVESGALTAQEIERTVRVLNGVGITSFVSSSGELARSEEITAVKNIRYFLRGGSEVCGFISSKKSADAVGLISVADRLFVKNAAELAADIRADLRY